MVDKLKPQIIKAYKVPAGQIAVWWLGQASFVIKSPQNTVVVLDPYLTDLCGEIGDTMGFDFHRITPPFLEPEDLVDFDAYVLTHSHEDHLDPQTLELYLKAGGKGPYIVPDHAAEKLVNLGIDRHTVTRMYPGKTFEIGDLLLTTTFAVPFGDADMTHVGYIFSIDSGPKLYFTGDTAYHEVIGISVAEYKPDVMFTVVNGTFRNLGPSDAARLASQIKPKKVIPYHYDLFPDGRMLPAVLKMNLLLYEMQDRYKEIEKGKPYLFGDK